MNKSFKKNVKGNLTYFTIPSFEETGLVKHGFSTRTGGVSGGAYESLNLSILTEDVLANVLENRSKMAGALGIDPYSLVGAHQVHGDKIYRVRMSDKGAGATESHTVIPGTDALMTDEPGLTLTAFFADCVPIFLLDPVNKAIALAHAGWKGTVAKISVKTVIAMGEVYGTKPERLLAAIGPSIGPCHYQVDGPVIQRVKDEFPTCWTELLKDFDEQGHAQLNLWEANVTQLEEIGLALSNITVAGLCTYCNQDLFYSHRGGKAGRQAALIMLK